MTPIYDALATELGDPKDIKHLILLQTDPVYRAHQTLTNLSEAITYIMEH